MTDDFTAAVELATRFRNAGLRTQIYSEQKKFKAKMTYADKLGIPYVVFLGEDEIAQGTWLRQEPAHRSAGQSVAG